MPETQSNPKRTSLSQASATHSPELAAALQAFNTWESNRTPAGVEPTNGTDTFTVGFWNIQRIPFAKLRNPDYRRDRLDRMMDILSQFDVAAISERFLSAPNTDHPFRITDNERGRMRLLPPGSNSHGLNISASMPLTDTHEQHYSVCGPRQADCLVKKGFIIAHVATPNGPVTVVTTHLDAGNGPRDKAARVAQLAQLTEALEPYAGKPLVLAGDLNLSATDAEENAHLLGFLAAQGLTLNARQTGKGHDVIASRGLELINTMEYNAPDLTDHPLEMARFRLPPSTMQQSSSVTPAAR